MKNNEPWVNASEAGQVSFCPNTVYLRAIGVKHSAASQKNMAVGTLHHEAQTNGKPNALLLIAIVATVLGVTIFAFILLGGFK